MKRFLGVLFVLSVFVACGAAGPAGAAENDATVHPVVFAGQTSAGQATWSQTAPAGGLQCSATGSVVTTAPALEFNNGLMQLACQHTAAAAVSVECEFDYSRAGAVAVVTGACTWYGDEAPEYRRLTGALSWSPDPADASRYTLAGSLVFTGLSAR